MPGYEGISIYVADQKTGEIYGATDATKTRHFYHFSVMKAIGRDPSAGSLSGSGVGGDSIHAFQSFQGQSGEK